MIFGDHGSEDDVFDVAGQKARTSRVPGVIGASEMCNQLAKSSRRVGSRGFSERKEVWPNRESFLSDLMGDRRYVCDKRDFIGWFAARSRREIIGIGWMKSRSKPRTNFRRTGVET